MHNLHAALRSLVVLAIVLTFGWSLVFAQAQSGEILGVVTDSATGASVPGASVYRHRYRYRPFARTIKSERSGPL